MMQQIGSDQRDSGHRAEIVNQSKMTHLGHGARKFAVVHKPSLLRIFFLWISRSLRGSPARGFVERLHCRLQIGEKELGNQIPSPHSLFGIGHARDLAECSQTDIAPLRAKDDAAWRLA
jgi:hypothetical protein